MLPNEDMFKTWVANNITEDGEKLRLQQRVTECFNEFRESGLFNTNSSKIEEVSVEASTVKKGEKIILLHILEGTNDSVSIHDIIFEMMNVMPCLKM
jgi:hypothetical protein